MEVYLVFGKRGGGLADGVAYASKEAALLSMSRQGQSTSEYEPVQFNLATLDMVQRWIANDNGDGYTA